MNFKKVKEIVKFNVLKSIQNKWFVILNVILLIAIFLGTNWNNISNFLEEHNIELVEKEVVTIQIVDNENIFYDKISEDYGNNENYEFEKVTENPYSKENVPEDNVILVEVFSDSEEIVKAKIVSKEGIEDEIYSLINTELQEVRSTLFAQKYEITVNELEILNADVSIERELLGVDAENSETKEMIKTLSIMAVYMVLLVILARISSEIIQEKVSKSIEYVLTSVTSSEYLLAKVLSVTISVLIQIVYIFIYYMIGTLVSNLFVTGEAVASTVITIDTSILAYIFVMIIYLLFTIFLTGLIQATLSSKATSPSDAGNSTLVLIIIIVALYMVSLLVISPYIAVTPLMYVISCLPFVSTFFVPSMMIIGQATTLQIIVSFIVLAISVPLTFKICSKPFKNGILDYTSSKKKRKNKKEISFAEKQEKDLKSTVAKKFGFNLAISCLIVVFLQVILTFLLDAFLPSITNIDNITLNIIVMALVSIISLGIGAWWLIKSTPKQEGKEITGTQAFNITFVGIAILAIIQVGLSFIYTKIGLNYDALEEFSVVPANTIFSRIIYIFAIALIPAIFEELFFRKGVLNYCKKYGNCFAVIFSAIFFAVFHLNLSQGIFALFVGILFGIIAIKTGSIKLTILLHFLNNLYASMQEVLSGSFLDIFNIIFVAVIIFAFIILIRNLPKIKNIKKENFKFNKDALYIFKDYTFVITVIFMVVMFIATENYLTGF